MELCEITGKSHEKIEFAEYWGWTDLETLARIALTPQPPKINDLEKEEIMELSTISKESFINGEDNKGDYYVELLHKSLAVVNVTDNIFSEEDVEKCADKLLKASAGGVILL